MNVVVRGSDGAISFLVDWPALDRAARIVLARSDELDGDNYTTLSHAAEALDARHPLAATLLRRAMVEDTLKGAKSTRYRHAARHLTQCEASEQAITDYGEVQTHDEFVAGLRQKHGRKYGFWSLVDG
jgi:enoyl-CoA hydratase/carnithine racemase